MTLGHFMKIITFEDFVHDYETAIKIDNNHYKVTFWWIEQAYNGLKMMNKLNEWNQPPGVFNIIKLIK